ncbi:putative WRKY transcription factor 66 [Arabidopsis thaliana]|uniref:WRKY domain n=3 Tax=Arabidopsis TaxID=3701 RepID=A0A8T2HPN7_ARASU|nr:WRKY domain [Arabidopsis thaliana x Arabidopsis arenosa]KAG7660274.1 WRKY domain [Arabidopsis suecica]OAP13809.1 WRKY66 [Arabidopsis thaliana]CAA0344597.1 unnamed protein product [Arabidopsis thaliana]CAD5317762.1 unnamed protein product [Arabidopsis thaliana]
MSLEIDAKAVSALLLGQGCANNLKTLLKNHETGSVSTEPLINSILDSFSFALSSQNIPRHVSQRSSKKKMCGIQGIEDSPTPAHIDGFIWRKYGQKTIKTSPHQRWYYRCAYAKDQNCDATKRVQKIQDNPPVYRNTYVGQHACEAPAYAVNNGTYGSKMIKFDYVMPESVMPQPLSIDSQEITMEDKDTDDHILNYINEHLMEDEAYDVFPDVLGERCCFGLEPFPGLNIYKS